MWLEVADATASAFVRRKNVHDDDRDDFFQIARLACWQADQDWKPGLTEHRKFISDRAWCRMLDLFAGPGYGEEIGRAYFRKGVRREAVSLDRQEHSSDDGGGTLGDRLTDDRPPFTKQSDERIDIARALEKIAPRAAAIIQLIDLDDVRQCDLAGVLGITEGRVNQIRRAGLLRMRMLMTDPVSVQHAATSPAALR